MGLVAHRTETGVDAIAIQEGLVGGIRGLAGGTIISGTVEIILDFLLDDDLGTDEDEKGSFILLGYAIGKEAVEAGDLGKDRHTDFKFGLADDFFAAEEKCGSVGNGDSGVDLRDIDVRQLNERASEFAVGRVGGGAKIREAEIV